MVVPDLLRLYNWARTNDGRTVELAGNSGELGARFHKRGGCNENQNRLRQTSFSPIAGRDGRGALVVADQNLHGIERAHVSRLGGQMQSLRT